MPACSSERKSASAVWNLSVSNRLALAKTSGLHEMLNAMTRARSPTAVTYNCWKLSQKVTDCGHNVAQRGDKVGRRCGEGGTNRFQVVSVQHRPGERIHQEAVGGEEIDPKNRLGDSRQQEGAEIILRAET